MLFARRTFLAAGIWGLLVMTPQWFTETRVGRQFPPPITHPEFYYGFVGTVYAWQVAFFIIARDPRRYRLLMLPAVLEKLAFSLAVGALLRQGRVAAMLLPFGGIDLVFAALFVAAYRKVRE